ncbi:MAG: hypothetical protein ACREQQ_00325, partial [Candidatus Binatia bacterium]
MNRLLLAASYLLLARLFSPAYSAGGLPFGSPLPPPSGDWVVRAPLVLADITVRLRGDLIVERGGMLDLRGVRIEMEGAFDGERRIEVRDGGSLVAHRSPLTGRATVFTAGTGGGRYSFHVHPLAGFLLDGAEVRDSGWDLENPGLVVERNPSSGRGELLVFDSDFHDNFVGLTLRECSG